MNTDSKETAQLAAIQGGMGEAVEVVGYANPAEYGMYRFWVCSTQRAHITDPLMTVSQHQRITAAMAAELAEASEKIENYKSQFGELHIARNMLSRLSAAGFEIGDDLAGSIIALRAELAEVKGREAVPVAYMLADAVGGSMLEFQQADLMDCQRRYGGEIQPLYTTPPASPDVEGLLRKLCDPEKGGIDDYWRENEGAELMAEIEAALSTWRQAHTPSTLPASSAEE